MLFSFISTKTNAKSGHVMIHWMLHDSWQLLKALKISTKRNWPGISYIFIRNFMLHFLYFISYVTFLVFYSQLLIEVHIRRLVRERCECISINVFFQFGLETQFCKFTQRFFQFSPLLAYIPLRRDVIVSFWNTKIKKFCFSVCLHGKLL